MTKLIVCDNCKKVVEYQPETKYERGTLYTTLKCPKCGYTKVTNRSHIHYGDDGK